jgi:hypothetical protein
MAGMPQRPPGALPGSRPPAPGWHPPGNGWRPPAPGWRPPAPGWRPPGFAHRPPYWRHDHHYPRRFLYWSLPLFAWNWGGNDCDAYWLGDGWLWPWQTSVRADCFYGPRSSVSFGFAW